jgi:hypothetical protein
VDGLGDLEIGTVVEGLSRQHAASTFQQFERFGRVVVLQRGGRGVNGRLADLQQQPLAALAGQRPIRHQGKQGDGGVEV